MGKQYFIFEYLKNGRCQLFWGKQKGPHKALTLYNDDAKKLDDKLHDLEAAELCSSNEITDWVKSTLAELPKAPKRSSKQAAKNILAIQFPRA